MTQQDGGSLETHVLSLVCGELSPILKESADLRAVGNNVFVVSSLIYSLWRLVGCILICFNVTA